MKNSVEHKESEQEGERVREVQLSEHQNRADDQQWLPESVQTGRRWCLERWPVQTARTGPAGMVRIWVSVWGEQGKALEML